MDEIRAQVALMSKQQRDVWTEGTARWSRDLELLRVGLQIMTAFVLGVHALAIHARAPGEG